MSKELVFKNKDLREIIFCHKTSMIEKDYLKWIGNKPFWCELWEENKVNCPCGLCNKERALKIKQKEPIWCSWWDELKVRCACYYCAKERVMCRRKYE